jgi:alkylated DNA repair dioxygenase AlkB
VRSPTVDGSFAGLVHHDLDAGAWFEVVRGWLRGADAVFETLAQVARWEQRDRRMYDKVVQQPRLNAAWVDDRRVLAAVPVLTRMQAVLGARYGVEFDSGGLNLYRDGRDSVAWHGDRIPKAVVDPVVAIVSVGAPRRFLARPRGGGRSIALDLGAGDHFGSGGTIQRTWQHAVPKVRSAAPRISITFRHGLRGA